MKRTWAVLAVLALAAIAGPAQAQSAAAVQLFGLAGGHVLSQTDIQARVQGAMVVSFRGDAAAGCAAYGLCPYSGTIVVRPQGGALSVITFRRKGRIGHAATLVLGSGESGDTTSARVQRSAPGGQGATCADAQSSVFNSAPAATVRGTSLTIRVLAPGGSLLQTRCAGPVDGDLAVVSPTVTVPLARAVRGRMTLDLSATRTFASHGFAGTVTSTLVLNLGRPQKQSSSGASFPPQIKTRRIRNVTERLSVVSLDGALSAGVTGTTDPVVCRLLDTCGLTGTLGLTPLRDQVSATVIAAGPASRPYADFLAALGLTRGGHARGISVGVLVEFLGEVRANVSQAGVTCADTAATGGVAAEFGSPFGGPTRSAGAFVNSWRTRCPGPIFDTSQGGLSPSVASGALQHRQFTITLRANGSFTDDGYVITPQGKLALAVRRGRVIQQVIREPVP